MDFIIYKPIRVILLVILILLPFSARAAVISHSFTESNMTFTLNFDRGYSYISENSDGKQLLITFDTRESIFYPGEEDSAFEYEEFFDQKLESIWLSVEGTRKRLYFTFENNKVIEPVITKNAKSLIIDFPVPVSEKPSVSSGLPGMGAYLRMFFGLGVIIAIIIASYFVMKFFFKTNIVSDIPGVGRLLGKVNLDIKKQLIFYELGETIYIIAANENSMNVLDKITDPLEVTYIKSGFTKRKDFSSYMKIFRKHTEIADDLKNSTDIIEEKVSSLKKK